MSDITQLQLYLIANTTLPILHQLIRNSKTLFRRLSQRVCSFKIPKLTRNSSTVARWEEEKLSNYNPSQFYQVCIGDVFKSRYEILFKLGYGGNSTVWLCEDLHHQNDTAKDDLDHPYRVLKVGTSHSQSHQETRMLDLIKQTRSDHVGQYLVRTFRDAFNIEGQNGCHAVVIEDLLGMSLLDYQDQLPHRQLTNIDLRMILPYLCL